MRETTPAPPPAWRSGRCQPDADAWQQLRPQLRLGQELTGTVDLGRVLHSAVLERDDDVSFGLAAVDRLLGAYGDAPWLRRDLTEPMLVYAVAFILWSMQGGLDGGAPWPPWWPNQAAALSAILDKL